MFNAEKPSLDELPSSAQLIRSTAIAAVSAVAILVTVVLPAEYNIDPTGIGGVLGLSEMGEIKTQLAEEADADRLMELEAEEQSSLMNDIFGLFVGGAHAQEAEVWRDETSFTLAPGDSAEWKLVMEEGQTAEYRMLVEGGRVNFDMHGHGGGQSVTYPARLAAWADAQQTAYEQNPDDIDAAALAALGRPATARGGAERIEVNASVGDALDALHEMAPEHPGVIHYAIHAYDSPPLKERGLPYAEIYDKAAPEAAHALHMPAHIFTQTGDWARSIDLNRRSAEAALDTSGDVIQTHYAHAVDYMVYGHLQMGQAQEAARLVDEMLAIDNHQVSFGGAYALAAAPVRLLLEQEKWAEAAALSPDMHRAIPWENFPQTVAMRWFAKGLGAARTDDVETARVAVEELGSLRDAMLEGGQDYWSHLTEGQILTVEAWIELAEGNDDVALTKQREAADLEDEAGKSPVTPGHVLPARELLGEMLRELGRTDEALEAYRATLAHSPNRGRSLAALN